MLALNFYRILVTIIYYNFQQVVTTTATHLLWWICNHLRRESIYKSVWINHHLSDSCHVINDDSDSMWDGSRRLEHDWGTSYTRLYHDGVLAAATRVLLTRGTPSTCFRALGRADPAVRIHEERLPDVRVKDLPDRGAAPAQAPGQGRGVDRHAGVITGHLTRVSSTWHHVTHVTGVWPLVPSIGTSHSQTWNGE